MMHRECSKMFGLLCCRQTSFGQTNQTLGQSRVQEQTAGMKIDFYVALSISITLQPDQVSTFQCDIN